MRKQCSIREVWKDAVSFSIGRANANAGAIDALGQESARGDLFEAEVSSIKQRSRLVGSTQLSEFVSANDFLNNTRGYECVSQPY